MAALVLTSLSAIICAHGGRVQHPMAALRVKAAGTPLLVGLMPSVVVGCPQPPPVGPGPCFTATWMMPSARVRAMGLPLLLESSRAMTATGPVAIASPGQTRVRAM